VPANRYVPLYTMRGGTLNLDNYALFSLGAGGRISGSNTDLMSEFSVRYLRCGAAISFASFNAQ